MELEVRAEIVKRTQGGDRIAVKPTRRFPGDYELSTSIPGGRWDPNAKFWHYPLTMVTCKAIRETYGDMLKIGPSLWRWAEAEKRQSAELQKLNGATDAPLYRIPQSAPKIDAAMDNRKYQRVGARFIADQRRVLLADEVSLGKTIQYLGGLVEADLWEGSHLVLAPKAALDSTWKREILNWTDGEPFVVPEGRDKRNQLIEEFIVSDAKAKFLICNPEMLRTVLDKWCATCGYFEKDMPKPTLMDHEIYGHNTTAKIYHQDYPGIFSIKWSSTIIDEAHRYALGIFSHNKKTQVGEGITRLREVEGAVRVAATGTPMRGRPMSFWSLFHWLDAKTWSSKWSFAESFLELKKHHFGTDIGDIRKDREQDMYDALASIMLRRTKKEVQPDLPEDVYVNHWVAMGPKQSKQMAELLAEGEISSEEGTLSVTGMLAEFTRQKFLAFGPVHVTSGTRLLQNDVKNSPKLDLLYSLLEERGIPATKPKPKPDDIWRPEGTAYKYIIVSQFTSILNLIHDDLASRGIESMVITGKPSAKKRSEAARRFQDGDDDCRILLINTISGGASLTLDAYCDEMFILDETWVRDDMIQVEGRIKNRDVEKRVATRFFHYLRTTGTIEEDIAKSGMTQDEYQKQLLDRRRGVKIQERKIS